VWRPQRQGFLARYLQEPEGLVETTERDENGRTQPVMKLDDNVVVPSRDIFLLVADEQGQWSPFVMFCTSTFHTFARGWNTYWRQLRHPKTGNVMPCYAHKYLLTTTRRSNSLGKWYVPKYQDLGLVTDTAVFNLARELNRVIGGQPNPSGDATRPAA
jgi:hypothetical protein